MKQKVLKKCNKLIAVLLSIMGIGGTISFTGCDGGGNGAVEYGTPHATFKIYGAVTSENKVAIPNIKVKMQYDSTYTDEKGKYALQVVEFPQDQNFTVRYEDIDGSDNGSYLFKDSIVEFKNPQFENSTGSWDRGETAKEVNVELSEDK